jgi:D-glycero-D-manno-heptose 1,7-bisphosphate phosphatase
LLLRWKPDLYIKGGDYSAGSLRSAEAVESYGGKVEVVPSEFGTSSSQVLDRIAVLNAHTAPDKAPEESYRGLVLLDRDGTLIRDIPFLHDPAQVELLPGVAEGLVKLQTAGLRLAIVSNQQGIGLGYFATQDFIAVNQKLLGQLSPHGVRISRVYFCPHSLAEQCQCRKPAAGMIHRALRDFEVVPGQTFVMGNTEADMLAGSAAGCRTVLVRAGDFARAADWILAQLRPDK